MTNQNLPGDDSNGPGGRKHTETDVLVHIARDVRQIRRDTATIAFVARLALILLLLGLVALIVSLIAGVGEGSF